jgi:multidrug efflux pump subunit AcrB
MDHCPATPDKSCRDPVEILISGQADVDAKDEATDIQTLRGIATQAMDVLRQSPGIAVMRDDWSPDSPQVKIQIDTDRANVVGISNERCCEFHRGSH